MSWCTFLYDYCLSCVAQYRKDRSGSAVAPGITGFSTIWVPSWWLGDPQVRQLHQRLPPLSLLCPLNIYLIPPGSLAPLEKAFKGRRDSGAVHWTAVAASHAPSLLAGPKLELPGLRKSCQTKRRLLLAAPLMSRWSSPAALRPTVAFDWSRVGSQKTQLISR